MKTEDRLRRWADAKALPSPYLQKWLALDEPGRTRLLEIAEKLSMHTGQFIAVLALIEEIALREGQTVREVLDRPSLRRVFNSAGSGPGRARVMLDELRMLRYPQLKRAWKRLTEEVASINLPPGIKVTLPRDLASEEVRVEVVAHGSLEMEQLLACLTAKSSALRRLAALLEGSDDGLDLK
jgi:hypothetical protein